MIDPRQIATALVGEIDWQNDVSGFCRCPGESLHTTKTGKKDCRVSVDGAPTLFCFHATCASAVTTVNQRLRRELGRSSWSLVLPDGQIIRSGDVLQASGVVLPREVVKARAKAEGRDAGEQMVLESLMALAERFKPDLFSKFRWTFAEMLADSPLLVADRDADEQFRVWLKIWPAHSRIWIGDVFSSGKPEHATHFRPVSEWYQIGPVMGNFTCGSAFKPGSFCRSNENIAGQRFLVVESDILTKDEIGAVFAYLTRRLHYPLHCIIDTAGRSLHGWFDAPPTKIMENRLKAGLTAFGCDPKLFTYSQPARVPGAFREGKLQKLVWLKN
ncbi:MAG: hypothetical protein WCH99_06520 [Verrucomicrobiota bacterium]